MGWLVAGSQLKIGGAARNCHSIAAHAEQDHNATRVTYWSAPPLTVPLHTNFHPFWPVSVADTVATPLPTLLAAGPRCALNAAAPVIPADAPRFAGSILAGALA